MSMDKATARAYRDKYRRELDECAAFWLENAVDREHGGIYNSLDARGGVFSRDKSVWLQGRCVWTFSYLTNLYGYKQDWRDIASHTLEFVRDYGVDPSDKRMYFLLTEDGRPLRKRRYFFSETFYIMGCAEYAKAFGDPAAMEAARWYYDFVVGIYDDPSSDPYRITPKFLAENRRMLAFAPAMILLNVSHVMLRCDDQNAEKYRQAAARFTADIFAYFYKEELGALLETVGPNGEFLRGATGGRVMNPGHALEGAWFLLTQARETGDKTLLPKIRKIFDWSIERGWDQEYGGILSFVDVLGCPPEALEHDMKLWWPMCEAMICALLLYEETGEEAYFAWFRRMDEYVDRVFKDHEHGEWFGYLHRDGTPTLPACKGNLFKGPFHLPRMLAMVEQCFARLEAAQQ